MGMKSCKKPGILASPPQEKSNRQESSSGKQNENVTEAARLALKFENTKTAERNLTLPAYFSASGVLFLLKNKIPVERYSSSRRGRLRSERGRQAAVQFVYNRR